MKEVIREFKRVFNLGDNSIREDKIEAETILKLMAIYLSLDGLDEVYLSPPSIEYLTKDILNALIERRDQEVGLYTGIMVYKAVRDTLNE